MAVCERTNGRLFQQKKLHAEGGTMNVEVDVMRVLRDIASEQAQHNGHIDNNRVRTIN
jgi:hypothetical protein